MFDLLKVACVQLNSGSSILENITRAAELVKEAAEEGAFFIATPENTCHIRFPAEQALESAMRQDTHTAVPFFADLAKSCGVTLLIGSLSIKVEDNKLVNRSFLFSKDGKMAAIYDKIHLFDVELSNGEIYHESNTVQSGDKAIISKISDDFTVGLSICYDLRFAYLYRTLAQAGANILCIPAAFTVPTGQAHWETLLRARAIETGSFVLAPAQVGEHENGRKTWGHTMIIDPWGKIMAQQEEGEGFITAELDIAQVHKTRTAIPALLHDREYTCSSTVISNSATALEKSDQV